VASIQVPQRVNIGSGGRNIPELIILNNKVREGAFKKICFTLDTSLSILG